MKHNLTKGRMDDFFILRMGKTPPRDNSDYWLNGTNNWVTISDMGKSKYISSTSECITDKGIADCNMVPVPANTVVMSFKLSIGKTAITSKPIFTNEAIMSFLPKTEFADNILVDYIYYYLLGHRWGGTGKKAVMGVTLNKASLSATPFSFPSLADQKQAIAELDKINDVIEDCRELLRNLDALAQSLFYDIFGDPITNPKGWQTQVLSEIAPQHPYKGKFSVDDDLWLLNLDMIEKNTGRIINRHKVKYEDIGNSVYKIGPNQVLYSKLRPNLNKVVIADDFGYCTSELLPLNPHKGLLNCQYLAYLLRTKECVTLFSGKVAGAKMPRTDLKTFRTFQIPIPPFELQEKFSVRIEQIEAEKKHVEATIAELQTLLASRMDYWFN